MVPLFHGDVPYVPELNGEERGIKGPWERVEKEEEQRGKKQGERGPIPRAVT